ncbi:MAG: polysaccharide biosynthesis/export family protein [Planctomycetales bacterium]|nr:polysaccharide biosynthesis/export family protein [Planctomycetales bacterium]
MTRSTGENAKRQARCGAMLLLVAAAFSLSGCAALTNPVANGVPVTELPPHVLAEPKEPRVPLPLTYLRQRPAQRYELAAGDVLGVYIEGVLGNRDEPPPVNVVDTGDTPPSIGYPVPVREDGTVPLPLIQPPKVEGMSVAEAQAAIEAAYTQSDPPILQPGRARIFVSLVRPRTTRVLVVRQDGSSSANFTQRQGGSIRSTVSVRGGAERLTGGSRQGTGQIVDLPAYENDVLNALVRTGGLPGLEAANEVIIQRGYLGAPPIDDHGGEIVPLPNPDGEFSPVPFQCPEDLLWAGMGGGRILRIPLRILPGQQPPFRPEDIILHPGDIVYVEARDAEVYYTGGLLPAGEFALPRDYDLDVIEAVLQVGGPLINGGFAVDNLRGAIVAEGLGAPSPKLLSVLRRLPDGRQITIRVDLHRAARDPRESLIVQPGDVLVLQETPHQAITRYATQMFDFNIFSILFKTSRTTGSASVGLP